MGLLTTKDVNDHSKAVFSQFGETLWLPNAKINATLERKSSFDLFNSGIGKTLVLAAMGASLEKQIPTLLKYRDRYDIVTCDKGFGPLLDRGIKADYVLICDAGIPFSYLKPWVKETEGVALLATPYANTEWTRAWKGPRYFFCLNDSIETERILLPMIGMDTRTFPAGSNVSNAMVCFFLGCDERNQANWGGYEKYLLVGYDYSWRPGGNYYAWDDPRPKRLYLHHRTLLDINNDIVYTSENLFFSCKWMVQYLSTFAMPVYNCSGQGLLELPLRGTLENYLTGGPSNMKLAVETVRQSFESVRRASDSFEEAKRAFIKTREALLCP